MTYLRSPRPKKRSAGPKPPPKGKPPPQRRPQRPKGQSPWSSDQRRGPKKPKPKTGGRRRWCRNILAPFSDISLIYRQRNAGAGACQYFLCNVCLKTLRLSAVCGGNDGVRRFQVRPNGGTRSLGQVEDRVPVAGDLMAAAGDKGRG